MRYQKRNKVNRVAGWHVRLWPQSSAIYVMSGVDKVHFSISRCVTNCSGHSWQINSWIQTVQCDPVAASALVETDRLLRLGKLRSGHERRDEVMKSSCITREVSWWVWKVAIPTWLNRLCTDEESSSTSSFLKNVHEKKKVCDSDRQGKDEQIHGRSLWKRRVGMVFSRDKKRGLRVTMLNAIKMLADVALEAMDSLMKKSF